MTEKRFTIKDSMLKDGYVIIDNEKEYTFPVLDSTLNYMFCKALNGLAEENELLKHQLQQQEMEYATTCNRLKKENEKLEALWEDKCIKKYMRIVGENALQEMHNEKYGDKE